MRRLLCSLLALATHSPSGPPALLCRAFAPSRGARASRRPRTSTSLDASSDGNDSRRDFLRDALVAVGTVAVAAPAALASFPLPSLADVSDGNALPEGAAQFGRVIKVRSQLRSVARRVREQSSEMDDKEWDSIDGFLRTVYAAGEDMRVIAKGMYDPAKKEKAEGDVKLLQGLVQAAQRPVSKRDAAGFGAVADKADGLFEDFFDLLRDVPDEL